MSAVDHPSAIEQELARQALSVLKGVAPGGDTIDVTFAGTTQPVHLPSAVFKQVQGLLANMADGQGVTLVPAQAELTTQQAAELLNVSRPHVIRLLDQGQFQYRRVGRHRRILASSLLTYQRAQQADARQAADDLAALTEDLGLY